MIAAPLLVYRNGEQKLWGTFRFAQLPSPGDAINITNHQGRVQELRVMYIAHEPLSTDTVEPEDHEPAWVHAEWVGEFF